MAVTDPNLSEFDKIYSKHEPRLKSEDANLEDIENVFNDIKEARLPEELSYLMVFGMLSEDKHHIVNEYLERKKAKEVDKAIKYVNDIITNKWYIPEEDIPYAMNSLITATNISGVFTDEETRKISMNINLTLHKSKQRSDMNYVVNKLFNDLIKSIQDKKTNIKNQKKKTRKKRSKQQKQDKEKERKQELHAKVSARKTAR